MLHAGPQSVAERQAIEIVIAPAPLVSARAARASNPKATRMRSSLVVLAAAGLVAPLAAQQPAASPTAPAVPVTITAKTAGLERRDGFVPVFVNAAAGQLWLELPKTGARMLVCLTMATGLGSNPVGLDRGSNSGCDVARFQAYGGKQLVTFENWNYRSGFRDNPAHARSVAEAFAPSTVAALPVIAEEGGRVLVDATDFVIRDWTDVARTLDQTGQGAYGIVKDRSYLYEPSIRAYPKNTELEAALTFEARGKPGPIVSQIAPDGRVFTLRQHLTLAELPDSGYRPREADPRIDRKSVV